MVTVCPHCSMNVMVKEDGCCPACKKSIFELPDPPQKELYFAEAKQPLPVHVILSICIYAVMFIMFIYLVSQFDFDVISFFMLLGSLFLILGIFSILMRKKWSRRYNIVLQIVTSLCALVMGLFFFLSGVLIWPGILGILILVGLQIWVVTAFSFNKKVISFLESKSK